MEWLYNNNKFSHQRNTKDATTRPTKAMGFGKPTVLLALAKSTVSGVSDVGAAGDVGVARSLEEGAGVMGDVVVAGSVVMGGVVVAGSVVELSATKQGMSLTTQPSSSITQLQKAIEAELVRHSFETSLVSNSQQLVAPVASQKSNPAPSPALPSVKMDG